MSFRHAAAVARSRTVEMQCRHGHFVRYEMQLNPFQLGLSRLFLKHFQTGWGILILGLSRPESILYSVASGSYCVKLYPSSVANISVDREVVVVSGWHVVDRQKYWDEDDSLTRREPEDGEYSMLGNITLTIPLSIICGKSDTLFTGS